jgi:hypothetical protein
VAIGTKVPQGLHASVVDGAALPFNTDAVKPISKLYRLDPSGPLPSTTTIRLPLISTVVADSGDLIIGVRAPSPEGPWAPLQAEVSTDGRFATFQTDHLSLFGIVRVIVRGVRGVLQFLKTAFDGFSGGLTAKAENPQCAGESAARRDQYTVISESKDTILWCFGLEEGRRVLRVVNNRRYPLIVEHPGLTVIDDGPSFQFRLAQLARAISGRSTVLFPNEQALFGVNLPNTGGTARLHTELNGAARSLYALEIGLRTAAMLLTYFGAGSGVPVNGALKGQLPWLDKLDETLRHADCFANITDVSFNVGKLIATCLSPARLLELFGRSAIVSVQVLADPRSVAGIVGIGSSSACIVRER